MNKSTKKGARGTKDSVKSAFFTLPTPTPTKTNATKRSKGNGVLQDKSQDDLNCNLYDKINHKLQNDRGDSFASLIRPGRKDTAITLRLRSATFEKLKLAATNNQISVNEAAGQIFDTYFANAD
jgi:hypothetical protein